VSPRLRVALLPLALSSALAQAAAVDTDPARWALCRNVPLFDWLEPVTRAPERADQATDLDAARVDVSGKDRYLFEDAKIRRADQRLAAQRIEYTHSTGDYRALGDVRYQDAGIAVAANEAHGNLGAERSELSAVRYQLLGARGNGAADRIELAGETGALQAVSYTTCEPDEPGWLLQAEQMRLNRERGEGSARNTTLRVGKLPVLWLPWFSFPIDDRRRSGFLYPNIGGSGDTGLDLRIPYYLNLAPNYDATVIARLISKRGAMIGGEFRYLGVSHGGIIEGSWLPDDDIAERDRGSLRIRHHGQFTPTWSVHADLNHVSDDRYFEDFGDSLTARATSLLASEAMLIGRGRGWSASLAAQAWEITDPFVPEDAEPFRRLPRARFSLARPLLPWLDAGVEAEAVAFSHELRPDAQRYDLLPWLALPIERAFGYVRPRLAFRQTGYQLDPDYRALGFNERSPTRNTPIFSLDSGLIFERQTRLFGTPMLQTLEPRLFYLRVPYREQSQLPIFDTQELTFGFEQLFRTNRFSGADRQADANQATFALTSRWYEDRTGRERLSASIGQIRYFDPPRVRLPGQAPTEIDESAFVAGIDVNIDRRLSLGLTQQWDPELDRSTVSGVRGQWRGDDGSLYNLAYRYRRGELEQVDGSFAIPLGAQWRWVGRWNYSLRERITLESFAGFQWESCCVAWRVLGRHYLRNREGETTNAIYLEVELKGLGSIGRQTGQFLERAILGYSR